jgi:diguanylate cyclase (GGDEF)-like protein
MSIRKKLLALFGTIAVLVIFLGATAVICQIKLTERAAITEAGNLAHLLADTFAPERHNSKFLGVSKKNKLQDYVAGIKKRQNLDLTLLDSQKAIIADVTGRDLGKTFQPDLNNVTGKTLQDGVTRTFIEAGADGKELRKIVVPLRKEKNKVWGALVLDYTKIYQEHVDLLKVNKIFLTILVLVCLVAAGCLSYVGSWIIAAPLRKLRQGIENISRGMLGVRVAVRSKDEIGYLAGAFNRMAFELKESRDRLVAQGKELEETNREIRLISQMGELLQSCRLGPEAFAIIAQSLEQLFPEDSGALFVFKSSRNLLEAVAVWGEAPPAERAVVPTDCMGMRRGQAYGGGNGSSLPRCHHLEKETRTSLCVPIGPPSEELGLLQVLAGPPLVQDTATWLQARQKLAFSLAERLALALANLKMNEDLRNQSLRDPLTGTFNRRYMEESLEREIFRAARQGITLGIIMIDLDHFKRFNDSYGHVAGDVLLRELGFLLRKHIRGSDIACRYGGEEFTLILPETSLEVVRKRAEELRLAAKRLKVWHVYRWLGSVTLSLGVAVFPDHGPSAKAVLQAADEALYRAKQAGRDRVWVAGEENGQGVPAATPPEIRLTPKEIAALAANHDGPGPKKPPFKTQAKSPLNRVRVLPH